MVLALAKYYLAPLNNMKMNNMTFSKPSKLWFFTEGSRALLDLGTYFFSKPIWDTLPDGDGHPVVIFPGFLASDTSTIPLRKFLRERNFYVHPWKLGRNLGQYEELESQMMERVEAVYEKHQRKVSLIGWSLGGVFAREVAKKSPHLIRSVITLGSPFSGITQPNNASWIFELISGKKIQDLSYEGIDQIHKSPSMPTTAIYSKTDGIVPWQSCLEPALPHTENIEVSAAHFGLGHNPAALICIADRLAQEEGEWAPFKPNAKTKSFFPS